ncbi:helix-turn-helix transcriptional regulator [Cryomorpha ignava]|uniref:Helix-turn-helix transcriptional regulator n=1 Tax=Cryomorpha ignava TaxID=101383 RepID=A0A7K3WPJ7_9FLAO|nr:helix-turn-helix transcriptional regulator [Cryomorpha ignava]NEN23580.1 helix-turn-helix transcriptional regulator [Cryomorpha ignava]
MDDFKPNIKLELVTLWSDTEARPIKVIKLIVNRELNERSEVHFFELDKLIQSAKSDQNGNEINFESLFHNLTKREQEILISVAKGATSIEISEELYISVNTVKNHRRNIKTKLNLIDTIEYSKFLRWVFLNIK